MWDGKSADMDQIQTGGRTNSSEIQGLCTSIWDKEVSPRQWKEPIIVAIYKKGDKQTAEIIDARLC
jgi:hypothetical protein